MWGRANGNGPFPTFTPIEIATTKLAPRCFIPCCIATAGIYYCQLKQQYDGWNDGEIKQAKVKDHCKIIALAKRTSPENWHKSHEIKMGLP